MALVALLFAGCLSGPVPGTNGVYLAPEFVWGGQGISVENVRDQRVQGGDTFKTGYSSENTIGTMDAFSIVLTNATPRQLIAALVQNPKITSVAIQRMEVAVSASMVEIAGTAEIALEATLANGQRRMIFGSARQSAFATTPAKIAERAFRDAVIDLKQKLDSI